MLVGTYIKTDTLFCTDAILILTTFDVVSSFSVSVYLTTYCHTFL